MTFASQWSCDQDIREACCILVNSKLFGLVSCCSGKLSTVAVASTPSDCFACWHPHRVAQVVAFSTEDAEVFGMKPGQACSGILPWEQWDAMGAFATLPCGFGGAR